MSANSEDAKAGRLAVAILGLRIPIISVEDTDLDFRGVDYIREGGLQGSHRHIQNAYRNYLYLRYSRPSGKDTDYDKLMKGNLSETHLFTYSWGKICPDMIIQGLQATKLKKWLLNHRDEIPGLIDAESYSPEVFLRICKSNFDMRNI